MDASSATASLFIDGGDSRAHSEQLQEIFARGLLNLDIRFNGPEQKLGLRLWQLGTVSVLQGLHSPCTVDSRNYTHRSDDLILMWGTTPGRSRVSQRGRDSCGDAGEAVLASCAHRLHGCSATTFRPLSVRLPRALLATYLPDCDSRTMHDIAPDNEALQLLKSYLPVACAEPVMHSPALAEAASHHLAELVALTLAGSKLRAAGASPGLAAARVHAIRRWVARNHRRPGLTVADASGELGLSTRYIQSLLHEQGTSLRELILDQRLTRVHRQLMADGAGHGRISALAYDAGFTDLSYFNHAFRARFGCAPREVSAAEGGECAPRQ